MKRTRLRIVSTVISAFLLVAIAATPSFALAGAGIATGRSDNGLWLVTAECSAQIGATTNGRDITFVVDGSAQAEGPAVSTAVQCHVYQGINGEIGGCGLALPGAVGACVGTAQGDLALGVLAVCAEATALYLDGSIAQTAPCP